MKTEQQKRLEKIAAEGTYMVLVLSIVAAMGLVAGSGWIGG